MAATEQDIVPFRFEMAGQTVARRGGRGRSCRSADRSVRRRPAQMADLTQSSQVHDESLVKYPIRMKGKLPLCYTGY